MLSLKPGVKLPATMPDLAMSIAIRAVEAVYASYGYDCIITSLFEGKHMKNSLHTRDGICRAADFRIWHVAAEVLPNLVQEIKDALGKDFDVILEKDHLHVEWDLR